MGFSFDGLPRHWFGGDVFRTHFVNGLHVVFPAGERFFIRSVRHYEKQLPDELRERVRVFYGQESQHQVEHRRAFAALEAAGLEVNSYLKWYERVAYEVIEPTVSPAIRLAVTAALEHYTATLATAAFNDVVLAEAHPSMQDLLRWHAAEEIEHKAVAYDVLQFVDPRYATRVAGFVIGTGVLGFFWGAGIAHFLRQEPGGIVGNLGSKSSVVAGGKLRQLFVAGLDYLRPDFHPDQHDDRGVAAAYLAGIGRLDG
jgi:predicted metal-dependent hydrolase